MKIGGIIREWYKKNRRELPWRSTRDPYRIWLSEVILQQTRVNQGLNYYIEFLNSFPDVHTLALAGEDEVLKKWQGLGYYSRARNLHQAARDVVAHFGGTLPRTYEGLLTLKGVGRYTAAAIASICFGEPRAVVDGNVSRVIARLFGVEEPVNTGAGARTIESLAMELLDRDDPGNHNQAMMEFGALQCVPVSPDCGNCPLLDHCEAAGSQRVAQLPVKIPRRRPVERWMYFYIIIYRGETILVKRGTGDIWKSLYHFPVVESDLPLDHEGLEEPIIVNAGIRKISDPIRHQLTHRTIIARFIHVEPLEWPRPLPGGWIKISLEQLDDFPVPRLINRYLDLVKI